ncbi:hypothetical protein TVAG_361140 [Trichomonas vaginalis G3]|uniref:Uncharacterized protein n=1 Tax=Trichomonas vaginalis (strain ATCC PRA-98 / G3) TaxID=412133 RepID=A2FNF1_TRIV3|nr:armadillo (ARM) repeat-containing protein family [Trichomonas vaginalis G3]EAX93559.1 hypothetical protein TVAG_361140 [Trichomonas vaginalis G3]KAI5501477.1 armadillo (ARM) repeat-containing protein family [Trichomonas vaginalis G3]|eukprot:XP_001306489.1 hypothetical protein [Trichomonas vaginalis G3]
MNVKDSIEDHEIESSSDNDDEITPHEFADVIQTIITSYSESNLDEFKTKLILSTEHCETTESDVTCIIEEYDFHVFLNTILREIDDADLLLQILRAIESLLYVNRKFTDYYISSGLLDILANLIKPPISYNCTEALQILSLFILDYPDRFKEFYTIAPLSTIYEIFLSIGTQHIKIDGQLSSLISKYIEYYSKTDLSSLEVSQIIEIAKFILSLDLEGSNTIIVSIMHMISNDCYSIEQFFKDQILDFFSSYYESPDEKKVLHITKMFKVLLSKNDFPNSEFPLGSFMKILESSTSNKITKEVCQLFQIYFEKNNIESVLQTNILEVLSGLIDAESTNYASIIEISMLIFKIFKRLDNSLISQLISNEIIYAFSILLNCENREVINESLQMIQRITSLFEANGQLGDLLPVFDKIDLLSALENIDPDDDEQEELIELITDKINSS